MLLESLQNIPFSFVPIALTKLECSGNEMTISDCTYKQLDVDTSCSHEDDLVISCMREFHPINVTIFSR